MINFDKVRGSLCNKGNYFKIVRADNKQKRFLIETGNRAVVGHYIIGYIHPKYDVQIVEEIPFNSNIYQPKDDKEQRAIAFFEDFKTWDIGDSRFPTPQF